MSPRRASAGRIAGSRRPRVFAVLVVALASFILASNASAAALSIEWESESACAHSNALERRLTELLGSQPEALLKEGMATQLSFVAQADSGIGLRVAVLTRSSSFERKLLAANCEEALEAAALVIALAIDPNAVEQTRTAVTPGDAAPSHAAFPPPVAAPSPTQLAAPVSPVPLPVVQPFNVPAPLIVSPFRAPQNPTEKALKLTRLLELGAVLDAGTLPNTSAGFTGAIGLGIDSIQLKVGALWLPPTSARVPIQGALDVSLMAGELRGCWVSNSFRLQGVACLGGEIGEQRARSQGVTTTGNGGFLWVAGLAAVQGQLELVQSTLWLWLRPEMVVPFSRTGFSVVGSGRVHISSAVEGRGALGLGVAF